MLNPIEKFKVAILHLSRDGNHWFEKLHWLVITLQADINEFQANTASFITAWINLIRKAQLRPDLIILPFLDATKTMGNEY